MPNPLRHRPLRHRPLRQGPLRQGLIRTIADAAALAALTGLLALPIFGLRTVEIPGGLKVEAHGLEWFFLVLTVFALRLLQLLLRQKKTDAGRSKGKKHPLFAEAWADGARRLQFLKASAGRALPWFFILFLALLPFMPFADRYVLDVAIVVLTYILLAWALNITVGLAGLLDLGFVAFYAIGAYAAALLMLYAGLSFWLALPIAGIIAALAALLLGAPVLRLRGDYFAIVTLGFGEILRLLLINWTELTGGPNGLSAIPRPTFFGLEFARAPVDGATTFHDFFGLAFDPLQRVTFLYGLVVILTLLVGWFAARVRRLPVGRAWEALREDDTAGAALGLNRTPLRLSAYTLAAFFGGLAGAFFATRQGFISPESFTFMESATVLAIVVLGGIGSPFGIALAALFVIGLPELFRDLAEYRMLFFGAGMVLIMLWRPMGFAPQRRPTVTLHD